MDKELITNEIIEAFKKIGIQGRGTKVAIAEICGLSRATVGLWFNRNLPNQRPTLESLVKISLATGVSLDQLVYGDKRTGKIPVLNHELTSEYIFDPWGGKQDKEYFAVRMEDDSMVSSGEKSYPRGRLMVFDKNVDEDKLGSGVIVFAKVGNHQKFYVCRQFIKIGLDVRLVALNSNYSTDFKRKYIEIMGVLVYSIEEETL